MLNETDKEAVLSRKLIALFPDQNTRAQASALLETYGTENYEKEPARVRLAILKLSGSSLEQLRRNTKIAKQDYRDVLAWAEYPRQSKIMRPLPEGPEKQKIVHGDSAEYEAWLSSSG